MPVMNDDQAEPVHKTAHKLSERIDTLRRLIALLRAYFEDMATDIDYDRVSAAVTERMDELGLTQSALSKMSGVSAITIRRLQGRSNREADDDGFRPDTLTRVSNALGLGHAGLVRIGRGEDLATVEADAAEGDQSDIAEMLQQMQAQLNEVAREVKELNQRLDSDSDGRT